MNNVINFPPRQRVKYRRWANIAAAGTVGGACGYWLLASLWPETFLHWLAGLLVVVAVLVTNAAAAGFHAQKVRLRRDEERRVREWRKRQAAFNRAVRAQERAQLRAAMEAPTQVIRILPPQPEAYVALDDRLRLRLLSQLTEQTGDLTAYEGPAPPQGWRTGVA